MGTFLHFHIKTEDRNNLVQILQERFGLKTKSSSPFPNDILENPVCNMDSFPDLLAIGQPLNGWISILHNGFAKLHESGQFLSQILHTDFIQIIGQENSDYYYFLYFSKGSLIREIEVDSMQLIVFTDIGEKFSFEKSPILTDDLEDESNFFDVDTLEFYCKEFLIDLPALYKSSDFILLKNNTAY
jgi:hypothetical protein